MNYRRLSSDIHVVNSVNCRHSQLYVIVEFYTALFSVCEYNFHIMGNHFDNQYGNDIGFHVAYSP